MSGKITRSFYIRLRDVVDVVAVGMQSDRSTACAYLAPSFKMTPKQLDAMRYASRTYIGDPPTAVLTALLDLEARYKIPLKHLRACRAALQRAA